MGKITVSRRSDGDKEGRAQLYVVVYINRDTIRLSTGIKVLESEWDATHERVKGKLSNDRNLIIDQMKSKVNNIFVKARLRDERLTKESFRRYWDCPAEFDSFHDYIDYYYIKVQRVKELNTLKTYRTVMRKLRDFSPGLTFKEINYDFGMRFLAHLRKDGVRDSTAFKNLAVFKTFVEAAKRDGYIERTTFDQIRIRKIKTDVVYLDTDEYCRLMKLYRSDGADDPLTPEQRYILGFWLFMANTSPHVGDAKVVTLEQLRHEELQYQRKKTRVNVTVPLNLTAKNLIREYAEGRKKGRLFHRLPCEQIINKQLKKIADIAGINKRLCCKTARHTFATIYYANTHDAFGLKSILGHSDLKDTMVYAHVLDSQKREGVSIFDRLK